MINVQRAACKVWVIVRGTGGDIVINVQRAVCKVSVILFVF